MLLENLQDGFYQLTNDDEPEPVVVYLYTNPDLNMRGFGFNTRDGGLFLPLSDVRADTIITPVRIVEA